MSSDKAQAVRLADVFVLGPFMIWFSTRARDVPDAARIGMVAAGLGTILYNGSNYLKTQKELKE